MSSLIKGIHKLISKGMYVLLFEIFNGYFCQTFTIKKNWRSQNLDFIGKKIWGYTLPLKNKKVQNIFGETFILALAWSSSAAFCLQNRVSDFF